MSLIYSSKKSYVCIFTLCMTLLGATLPTVSARICEGPPGFLGELLNFGDLTQNMVTTAVSYECPIDMNPPYEEFEARCYMAVFDDTYKQLIVYEVKQDGSVTEIDSHAIALGTIKDLAFFKCETKCYLVSGGDGGNDTNRVWEIDQGSGVLSSSIPIENSGYIPITGVICGVTGCTADTKCYVVTVGDDPETTNHLYEFLPPSLLVDLGQFDASSEQVMVAVTSVTCAAACYVITAGQDDLGNIMYRVDPCTDSLVNVDTRYYRPSEFDGLYQVVSAVLTTFDFDGFCFLAVVWVDGTGASTGVLFILEIFPEDDVERIDAVNRFSIPGGVVTLNALQCDCHQYLVTGGPSSGENIVFEKAPDLSSLEPIDEYVLSELTQLQSFSDLPISVLTSHVCCNCYVVSFGSEGNAIFQLVSPTVTANNDCFCIDAGLEDAIELDLFSNDCGSIDTSSVRFYRDKALTNQIGSDGSFSDAPTQGLGQLSYDAQYGIVTYKPPCTGPVTDCFYYTIDPAQTITSPFFPNLIQTPCTCQGCAKVTVFVKEVASCCSWQVERVIA